MGMGHGNIYCSFLKSAREIYDTCLFFLTLHPTTKYTVMLFVWKGSDKVYINLTH